MSGKRKKLKIGFVNPPHADWSLANNVTYLLCQSHYTRNGKYSDSVEWIPAPYKWNAYTSYEDPYNEVKEADIIMFSSYAWNYPIVDTIAKMAKADGKITVLGGPHIGTNEPEFLAQRDQYDFICQPTKPGEPFIEDLIDCWFENSMSFDNIAWELRSSKKRIHDISKEDYSVYEDHQQYLSETLLYARSNKMEPFIVIETTRGCPYKCVFCEWGGGINTKIYKKSIDIVKRDITAMKNAGFRDAYLTDANFGVFEERDLEIFAFAYNLGFNLTDISTLKSKDLERRKRLIDGWFNIVGKDRRDPKSMEALAGIDMWESTDAVSVVPTVSIQSISDEAMKIADRVDLSTEDKLKLSHHINQRCEEYGFPVPGLELILAMPGSTVQDFYKEAELIWNFKAWNSFRHDYMFLPDSRLNSESYKKKYSIETVEVYSDIVDEDGADNWDSLYKEKKTYFKTIRACFSFTEEEMKEMWFMNNAVNYILKNWYVTFENTLSVSEFSQMCYNSIKQLPTFQPLKEEIDDIFNPQTPPRSIRKLGDKFRVDTIEEFLAVNKNFILSGVMAECLID